MWFDGPVRARGIGFLALVLALTASRSNFPLSDPLALSPNSATFGFSSRLSAAPRKYDGVTPSRRHFETRRNGVAQARDAELPPRSLTKGFAANLLGAARTLPAPGRTGRREEAALTCPQYLQPFLLNSPASSLPPPV